MAGFNDEIQKATQHLEKFNRALGMAAAMGGAGGGAGGSGAGGAGGGAAGAVGMGGMAGLGARFGPWGAAIGAAAGAGLGIGSAAVGAVTGAAQFATPAANQFAVTGSSAAFAGAITSSLVGAATSGPIGGFLGALSGAGPAQRTLQAAGMGRASDLLGNMARIGVTPTEEFRKSILDTAIDQEGRVTEEMGKIKQYLDSSEAWGRAKPKGAVGDGFDEITKFKKMVEGVTGALDNLYQVLKRFGVL